MKAGEINDIESAMKTAHNVLDLLGKHEVLEALKRSKINQSKERIEISGMLLGGHFEASIVFDNRRWSQASNDSST